MPFFVGVLAIENDISYFILFYLIFPCSLASEGGVFLSPSRVWIILVSKANAMYFFLWTFTFFIGLRSEYLDYNFVRFAHPKLLSEANKLQNIRKKSSQYKILSTVAIFHRPQMEPVLIDLKKKFNTDLHWPTGVDCIVEPESEPRTWRGKLLIDGKSSHPYCSLKLAQFS